MRELDGHSIADEVLRRFEGCENRRLKPLRRVRLIACYAIASV